MKKHGYRFDGSKVSRCSGRPRAMVAHGGSYEGTGPDAIRAFYTQELAESNRESLRDQARGIGIPRYSAMKVDELRSVIIEWRTNDAISRL